MRISRSHLMFEGSLAGAGWMLLACIMFTGLAVIIKYASQYFTVAEIVFYRNLMTVCISSIYMLRGGFTPSTPHWRWAILLGLAAATSNFTYGYGLAHLPFSTANALNYTHPIFLAVFGVLLFKLPIERTALFALFCAFLGVLLLLQPKSLPPEQWTAGLLTLISGITAGLLNLLIFRLKSLGEPSTRIVWYFGAFAASLMAVIILRTSGFQAIHGIMWTYIALLGLTSAAAQFLLVRAFQAGQPNITSLFSYSTVLYAVILDLLVFQKHHFNVWSGAGIALILGGGLLVSWFNPTYRARQSEPPTS